MSFNIILWLFAGFVLSLVHGRMIVRAVRKLGSESSQSSVWRMWSGSLLRIVTLVAVLGAAVLDSVLAAIAAGLGMLLGRWGFVLLVRAGRIGGSDEERREGVV